MSDVLQSPHDRNVLPYSRPETPYVRSQIGFVGLGAMGYFMARNLARARSGHGAHSSPLIVWNRTVVKSEKLQSELGVDEVHIAQSPAEVATKCDVIITNLSNDEVVRAVYEEYSKALSVRSLLAWFIYHRSNWAFVPSPLF
jgi:3-hydroxyisobutyrate dehydrogenase-like beta-hydroxyacid dehydrogenase